MISLKEAERFHGHLGPWLVLGILMGEYALEKLKVKKYFDLQVEIWGANKKPKSCLIDGLQLSTGATYGKGNIQKLEGEKIQVLVRNLLNHKKIKISPKEHLIKKLDNLSGHKDSKEFAKKLYRTNPFRIFNLIKDA